MDKNLKTPKHVAFIMDGNRRWAMKNKLTLFFGHENGAKRLEPLVEYAIKREIEYLTFWAFSTENWNRSKEEVNTLMDVFRRVLRDPMMKRLEKNNVKIQTLGDTSSFPSDIQEEIYKITNNTKNNSKITVNIALNYGGREEIIQAIKKILHEKKDSITISEFSNYLYTKGQTDPDLIIRTGGEKRLSGYLPWQSVYSELYFTNVLWPDFKEEEFEEALIDFEKRQRRFGE